MFQEEGASTARTGVVVVRRAEMTGGKGSRTAPVKEKPVGRVRWVGSGIGGIRGRRRTEDGVNDVVCLFEGAGEVVCEGDFEVFELFGQALGVLVRHLGSRDLKKRGNAA